MAVAAPTLTGGSPEEARRRRLAGQGRAAVGGGFAACPGLPGRATATAATESPPGESGSTSGYRRVQARAAPREGLRGAPQRQQGGEGLWGPPDPGKKEKETDP